MKLATLKQGKKVLSLLENVPEEQLQNVLESGLLSDLLNANVDEMNRDDFWKLCSLVPISTKFPIWKTIKIGTPLLRTAEDFRRAIRDKGMRINDWANDILRKSVFTVATEETELDLVKVTGKEIGLTIKVFFGEIYARAKEFGFEFCPLEAVFQLRLQCQNQLNRELILIATKPITDAGGNLEMFNMQRIDSELWLHRSAVSSVRLWNLDDQWVFVRPK